MELICLTRAEFEDFRDVQIKPRADGWPAVFSCNPNEEVWPFNGLGLTYEENRFFLQGQIPLLDDIVQKFLVKRPEGGRFFLDDRGVFFGPQDQREQIIKFVVF